jgi:peptidoglycan/LPS O-acetylase OafA/YrhL
MTVRGFMTRRLIRLYPLIFLGAGGGLAMALVHTLSHGASSPPLGAVITSGLLSLCLLPYFGPALGENAFSFNPPLWSLSFELLANLAYALLARRLSASVLTVIILAGLAGTIYGGPLGGGGQADFFLGLPRVACGFFGGILLHRLHKAGRLPRVTGRFLVLAAALLSAVCCPWIISGWMFVPIYLLFCLIIAGAADARPGRLDGFCTILGVLSYPLYTLQWLSLFACITIAARLDLPYTPVALVHAACAPLIAYALARRYETPVRRYLSQWLLASSPREPPKAGRIIA